MSKNKLKPTIAVSKNGYKQVKNKLADAVRESI